MHPSPTRHATSRASRCCESFLTISSDGPQLNLMAWHFTAPLQLFSFHWTKHCSFVAGFSMSSEAQGQLVRLMGNWSQGETTACWDVEKGGSDPSSPPPHDPPLGLRGWVFHHQNALPWPLIICPSLFVITHWFTNRFSCLTLSFFSLRHRCLFQMLHRLPFLYACIF